MKLYNFPIASMFSMGDTIRTNKTHTGESSVPLLITGMQIVGLKGTTFYKYEVTKCYQNIEGLSFGASFWVSEEDLTSKGYRIVYNMGGI